MPGGDGTGPAGMGPMTGRAAGYCAGYPVPGFMNPIPGRGFSGAGYSGYAPYGGYGAGVGYAPYGGYGAGVPYAPYGGYGLAGSPGYAAPYYGGFRRGFGRGLGFGLGRGMGFGRGFGRGRGFRAYGGRGW